MPARLRLADRHVPWVLAAASFVVYAFFFPTWPTEWDSVQLTFGVDRFDVRAGSPHPPGYWLYVAGGRLLRALTPLDAQDSLQVLSALAASATVAVTYLIGRDVLNRWLGLAAAAFLVSSPFLLFYGATVASYAFDALLSVLLVLLALRARPGSWHGVAAAAVLGLGAGFRQSSLFILVPVVLWAVVASVRSVRRFVLAGLAGVVGLAAWVVPMLVEQPGGLDAYLDFSRIFYRPALSGGSLLYGATWEQARNNMSQASGYTLAAVAGLAVMPFVGWVLWWWRRRGEDAPRPGLRALVLLWLAALLPFAFVFLVFFGKAGYVLSYLPAVALLLLLPAARLAGPGRVLATVVLAAVCLVNVQRFVFAPGVLPLSQVNRQHLWFTRDRYGAPYPLTLKWIKQTDDETSDYLDLVREFDPDKDVLVYVALNGGHRFRHACFSMPQIRIHFVADGMDHFLCRHGRLLTERNKDIELPDPTSRAVFVFDAALEPVQELAFIGFLRAHELASGRTVWVGPPGITIYGVTPTVTPDAPLKEFLN